ncbi:hypothetical protein FD723_40055 (plasmid) [Nostoc sp. C052]|uniref:hypothetical protein n=1 Tax=Nostoc sp. C052 TaxID=2576902 RepID=UPI0015C409E6|nr:hypothetical protein [Nostoc sp. C052]QLE46408.1 hypothetical protein FD723_40055 [Nostoc sp. C052]
MSQSQIAYNDNYPRKNKILNGEFIVAQRGTVFNFAPLSNPIFNYEYTLDRFIFTASNASGERMPQTKVTQESFIQGSTGIPGEPRKYLRINFIDAGASLTTNSCVVFDTLIDEYRSLFGQIVTLSFYARTSGLNRKIGLRVYLVDKDTANNVKYIDILGKTVKTDTRGINGWSRFVVTFQIPSFSDNYNTAEKLMFQMMFQCGTTIGALWGTNATPAIAGETIDITDLKLEAGNSATPIARRNYLEELLECQRYYWNVPDNYSITGYNEINAGSGNAFFVAKFPVPMLKVPTVKASNKFYVHVATIEFGDKPYSGIRILTPENCHLIVNTGKPNLCTAELRVLKSSGQHLSFSAE